jgi:hypothetical protein
LQKFWQRLAHLCIGLLVILARNNPVLTKLSMGPHGEKGRAASHCANNLVGAADRGWRLCDDDFFLQESL